MLKHVVLFKLTDPGNEAVADVVQRLRALRDQVAVIRDLEAGTNLVESPRAYHIALIVTLDSLDDLEAYQNDPAHQAFLAQVRPLIEVAASVDFTTP
jgi:hypothetical protein